MGFHYYKLRTPFSICLKNCSGGADRERRNQNGSLWDFGQFLWIYTLKYLLHTQTQVSFCFYTQFFSEIICFFFLCKSCLFVCCCRDCPNDVNEAVSSLLFASARCGDLPELQLIRKLFGERYGHSFETSAVELNPGNLVNLQVQSISDYALFWSLFIWGLSN